MGSMQVLFPGKSFVNGRQLLGDTMKTDQELALLFPPGLTVWLELVSQVHITQLHSYQGRNLAVVA